MLRTHSKSYATSQTVSFHLNSGTDFQCSTLLTTPEIYNTLFKLFIFSNAECYLLMSDLVNWFSFDLVLICNDTVPFIIVTNIAVSFTITAFASSVTSMLVGKMGMPNVPLHF